MSPTFETDERWHVGRVTAVSGSAYSFLEQWYTGSVWEEKVGGLYGDAASDPGRVVGGAVLAVGDLCLFRRAGSPSAGLLFELTPLAPGPCESGVSTGNCLTPVSLVTNVCPITEEVSTGSGVTTRVMTGITVERRTAYLPAAWLAGPPSCEVNPDDCCGPGGFVTVPCCDVPVSRKLCVRLTVTGGCDCASGLYEVVYQDTGPYAGTWYGTLNPCGGSVPGTIVLSPCDIGGNWPILIGFSGTTFVSADLATDDCSPLALSATTTTFGPGSPNGCTETADPVTITVTAPDIHGNCTSPPSWNCVDGTCVDPGDGTGEWGVLADCTSTCLPGGGCCEVELTGGSTLTLVIDSGPNAGSYTPLGWTPPTGGDVGYSDPVTIPASPEGVLYLVCTGGSFQWWWYAVDPGTPPTDPPDQAWASTVDCGSQLGQVNFGGFFGDAGNSHWGWT